MSLWSDTDDDDDGDERPSARVRYCAQCGSELFDHEFVYCDDCDDRDIFGRPQATEEAP